MSSLMPALRPEDAFPPTDLGPIVCMSCSPLAHALECLRPGQSYSFSGLDTRRLRSDQSPAEV